MKKGLLIISGIILFIVLISKFLNLPNDYAVGFSLLAIVALLYVIYYTLTKKKIEIPDIKTDIEENDIYDTSNAD